MSSFVDLFPAGVPSLAWTKLQGNSAWVGDAAGGFMKSGTGQGTTTKITMRCDSALATNDHQASLWVACTTTNSANAGPVVRVPTTANAIGYDLAVVPDATDATVYLNRMVNGIDTTLTTWPVGSWTTTFRKLTLKVAGTNPVHLEAYADDVLLGTFEDSNAARIQTGLRAGTTQQAGLSGTAIIEVDSFSAADWVYVRPVKDLAAKVPIATNAKQGIVLQYR